MTEEETQLEMEEETQLEMEGETQLEMEEETQLEMEEETQLEMEEEQKHQVPQTTQTPQGILPNFPTSRRLHCLPFLPPRRHFLQRSYETSNWDPCTVPY